MMNLCPIIITERKSAYIFIKLSSCNRTFVTLQKPHVTSKLDSLRISSLYTAGFNVISAL